MFKGLGNLANLGSMLKQAQQLGGKLSDLSESLKTRRVEGQAGGGLVSVEANGIGEILRCRIDPSLVAAGDREMIEDLLPGAVNQALEKSKQLHAEAMKAMAADFDVPGLRGMLAQLSGGEEDKPSP